MPGTKAIVTVFLALPSLVPPGEHWHRHKDGERENAGHDERSLHTNLLYRSAGAVYNQASQQQGACQLAGGRDLYIFPFR